MNGRRARGNETMGSTLADPKMRRLAFLAASVAMIGVAGGALIEHYRGEQDETRRAVVGSPQEPKSEQQQIAAAPDPAAGSERTDNAGATVAPAEPSRTEAAISPVARSADAPSIDSSGLRQAIELYRKGDLAGGDRAKASLTDSAARTLSEWVAVRFGGWVGFDRIARFMRDNPDWPVTAALRRRAEEALLVEKKPTAVVRAFFAEQKPASAAGKVALAFGRRWGGAGLRSPPIPRSDTAGHPGRAALYLYGNEPADRERMAVRQSLRRRPPRRTH